MLFTRDGEETIRAYVEDEPWADVVEVRNGASATLAELKAEQAEANQIKGKFPSEPSANPPDPATPPVYLLLVRSSSIGPAL